MKNMNEDHTRRILNLIREGKVKEESKLIKEQEETLAPTDEMMPDEFETAPVEDVDEDAGEDRDLVSF